MDLPEWLVLQMQADFASRPTIVEHDNLVAHIRLLMASGVPSRS